MQPIVFTKAKWFTMNFFFNFLKKNRIKMKSVLHLSGYRRSHKIYFIISERRHNVKINIKNNYSNDLKIDFM